MNVSVLNNVKGNMIYSEIKKLKGFDPNQTFKIVVTPDKKFSPPLKRKTYKKETLEILAKAKKRAKISKKSGKTREESVEQFEKIQKKIDNLF